MRAAELDPVILFQRPGCCRSAAASCLRYRRICYFRLYSSCAKATGATCRYSWVWCVDTPWAAVLLDRASCTDTQALRLRHPIIRVHHDTILLSDAYRNTRSIDGPSRAHSTCIISMAPSVHSGMHSSIALAAKT